MNKIFVLLLAIFPLSIFAQPTFSEFELYHYLNLGKEYYSQQRYDASIREFNELIEKDPLRAEAYQYRANAYFHTRRYREAIRDYDEAIVLNDQLYNRFNSNQRVDVREVGIMEPEADIRYKLEYAMLFYNRGASKYHLSRYDEALDDFEQALSINPDLETAQFSREKASERARNSLASRYAPSNRQDNNRFTIEEGSSSYNNRYSDKRQNSNWPNNNSSNNSSRNTYSTQDRYVPTNTNSSNRYNDSRKYNNKDDDDRYYNNSSKVSSNSSGYNSNSSRYKPNTNSSRYKSNTNSSRYNTSSTYDRRDTKTNNNGYANNNRYTNRYNNDDRYKASVIDGRNTNYSTNSTSKSEVESTRYPQKRATISDWFSNRNSGRRDKRNSNYGRYANNNPKQANSRKERKPLISPKNKKQTYRNPTARAQTAQYVSISSIVTEENSTMVHFSVTNYQNELMRLFLERPNTDGAFFLVDAENQREYRMIRAYGLNLRPYETELKVGGTMSFSIEFERIDDRVKRLHILEGVDESDTRWNFYDVSLQ